MPGPSAGYTPTINAWHHIVVTFNGTVAGRYPGNETVYVDGVANWWTMRPYMAIGVPKLWYLGAWVTNSVYYGGEVAIGALRMHDHALTPAQVLYNYNADYLNYYPTPSITPTPTTTATNTASPSNTPSATQSPTGSLTVGSTPSMTATSSFSSTATATSSQRIQTASLLIDMQAVDFNSATLAWDNRITPQPGACLRRVRNVNMMSARLFQHLLPDPSGTVSIANGDFVANGVPASIPVFKLWNNNVPCGEMDDIAIKVPISMV